MNFRRIFLGNTEYRLLAVGAYSFAAFSVAALVQILSSGPTAPELHPYLAKIAFTAMPLLAAGLSLDFYCFDRPRMAGFAGVLCAAIGALIAVSSSALGAVLGVYSTQIADYMNYGVWSGITILIIASVASWLMENKATTIDGSSTDNLH